MDTTRQLNSQRPEPRKWLGVLLGTVALAIGGGSMTGCAAEEKKPQTVTEWMQQRRVGEDYR
jgi:hypothetical protein